MRPSSYQKTNDKFITYLKSRRLTAKSIASVEKGLKRFVEWLEKEQLEAEQITYNDLLLFVKSCQRKNLAQRTIQNYINHVSHYFDYLIEEKRIATNPAASIEIKGVKRKILYYVLEPTALNQLYNNYPSESYIDRRNKVMLGLLVYQGLKTEELGKLKVNNIKLREGKIEVAGSRRSEGRTQQLEPHQVMDMYDYVLQVRPQLMEMRPKRTYQKKQQTERLFIGEGGMTSHFNNYITQLMKKARNLNKHLVNAKQIRASVITKWLKSYNLREVQYRAGHRYIGTTESYKVNDLDGLKEEINQFHPLG